MKQRVSTPTALACLGAALLCACSEGGDGQQMDGAAQAVIHVDNAEDLGAVVSTLSVLATTPDLFLAAAQVPSATQIEPCPSGGAVEYGFMVDLTPQGQVSEGDELMVAYDLCRDSGGQVDGDMGFNFVEVTVTGEAIVGEGEDYELEMDLGFANLNFERPESGINVNGLLTVGVTGDATGSFLTLGGWVRATHTRGLASFDDGMTDALITVDVDVLPDDSYFRTVTVDGNFESKVIPGELLTLETVVPFLAFDGENPFVGELKITAGDNSALHVVVLDDVDVELRVDTDGDGTFEYILLAPWEQM